MGCFLTLFAGAFCFLIIGVLAMIGVGGLLSDISQWAKGKFARQIGWCCKVVPENVRAWIIASLVVVAMVSASILFTYAVVWIFGEQHGG